MTHSFSGGTVYMVVRNDDLTGTTNAFPPLVMEFAPKRRTIKWRGRRFNVPTVRIVRIGNAVSIK